MKPCGCPAPGRPGACRVCWLYDNDPVYRALWGGPAIVPFLGECLHLGKVLDRLSCPCELKWVRQCDLHGQTTLLRCRDCADLVPE
jgi:hypothetical protein